MISVSKHSLQDNLIDKPKTSIEVYKWIITICFVTIANLLGYFL